MNKILKQFQISGQFWIFR